MSHGSPRQTRSYLMRRFEEVGLHPKTRYGQNFLIDLNLLDCLVDAAKLSPSDVVLEVGAGTGALTSLLAQRAGAVVSVEVDSHLAQLAREQTVDFPNVTLLVVDALKNKNRLQPLVMETVAARLAEAPHRRFKLAANLPYNIATPLISNLLASPPLPVSMTVTIQKELADRILASPGTKDYGALSIWIQAQCRVELMRVMPPEAFWPRPKVTSAILHIELDPARRAALGDVDFFHQFVRDIFCHRRKFLRSELIHSQQARLDKADVDAVLAETGFDPMLRAEQLDVAQMLELCHACQRRILEKQPLG